MTIAVIAAALALTLAAGFNDGGNLLAVAASSRTISPARSLVLIVAGAIAGPLLFGTAVATTTGAGIADFHAVGPGPLLAALAGTIATVGTINALRIPTSLSAALFSAMVGALLTSPGGAASIHWSGIARIATAMASSVVVGSLGGSLVYRALTWLLERMRRAPAERLLSLQYVTVVLLAMGYGANDLEKSAGLLAAVTQGESFSVPAWTLAAAVAGFAGGLAIGGTRVAKTVGGKLFSVRPASALAAETAAATTVVSAALLGGPLSTTDTSASALVGVGAAANPRAVRWQVVREIGFAWVITIPAAFVAGAIADAFVRLI